MAVPEPSVSPIERWRSVAGYEGLYEVSDKGRVRSLDRIVGQRLDGRLLRARKIRGTVLRPAVDKDGGYRSVHIFRDGAGKTFKVCHLVARAFIGPRPDGLQVCHNDGVANNDQVYNLRYDTALGNNTDKLRHGTFKRGSACSYALVDEDFVRKIRAVGKTGTWPELAAAYGISAGHVRSILNRKSWRHV